MAITDKQRHKIEQMLLVNTPEEIYKMVLDGTLDRFPRGFWSMPENYKYAAVCTKYLVEEVLKFTKEDIKGINSKHFMDNKLGGMFTGLFKSSPVSAIYNAYGEIYPIWQFNRTSNNYWSDNTDTGRENAIKATKWLIEEVLKLDINEELRVTEEDFKEAGLYGMLNTVYNTSIRDCIFDAYGDICNKWEFSRVSRGYWNSETAIKATVEFINNMCKDKDTKIKKLKTDDFKEAGLGGMLSSVYGYNVYRCINAAYPNRFKEWEIGCSNNYWDSKDNRIKAIKWLVEDKLNGDRELVCKITRQKFKENNLGGMLVRAYSNSPFRAIDEAYPGEYKPWEFKKTPNNYWNEEKAREATMWLIEERLKYDDERIMEGVELAHFKENGLYGMITKFYSMNINKCIADTYPNKFKYEDRKLIKI